MINKLFLILISCFALTIFAACTSNGSPATLADSNQSLITDSATGTPIPSQVTAEPTKTPIPTETAVPTETPPPTETAVPTETATSSESTTHIIDLYSLQLTLPPDWTISELNRREEPTDWGLVLGHDCADYTIANSDTTLQIRLLPVCGMGEGANFLCPSDTVIIGSSIHPDSPIVRFLDPYSQIYGYTEAYEDLTYCADSPRISYMDGDINSYMLIEFDYTGHETNLQQLLPIADDVIGSIHSAP